MLIHAHAVAKNRHAPEGAEVNSAASGAMASASAAAARSNSASPSISTAEYRRENMSDAHALRGEVELYSFNIGSKEREKEREGGGSQ